jgi:hypothetical protein
MGDNANLLLKVYVNRATYLQFKQLCERAGVSVSTQIRMMIMEYIMTHSNAQQATVANNAPLAFLPSETHSGPIVVNGNLKIFDDET